MRSIARIGGSSWAGQTYTYGSRAKVRQMRSLFGGPARGWIVTNHLAGNQSFDTWEEAMCYANSRPVMINARAGALESGPGTAGYVATVT